MTEEGFVLDARQGKALDEKIKQTSDNLSKMIQASGVLYGNTDWNIYLAPGVYKVQNCNMIAENHAPVGMFPYGILLVFVSEIDTEYRTLQEYFPNKPLENSNIAMVTRMYNCHPLSGVNWQPWYAVSGTLLQ